MELDVNRATKDLIRSAAISIFGLTFCSAGTSGF